MKTVRYQIAVTYRCNLRCSNCYQTFDVLPAGGEESDLTEEDIVESGKILAEAGIRPSKLRFTGGEPLLHPRLQGLYRLAKAHWDPVGHFRVYSSGVRGRPAGLGMAFKSPRKKVAFHDPLFISPADHEVPIVQGADSPCRFALGCGRGFDAYGFTPCCRAWSIGRLFGFDVHSRRPRLLGWGQLCEHCIYGVSPSDYAGLVASAKAGGMDYPSPSYRAAIEGRLKGGFLPTAKFAERRD